jgi:hypothetical protein
MHLDAPALLRQQHPDRMHQLRGLQQANDAEEFQMELFLFDPRLPSNLSPRQAKGSERFNLRLSLILVLTVKVTLKAIQAVFRMLMIRIETAPANPAAWLCLRCKTTARPSMHLRPPSAIATACFLLVTSNAINAFAILSHGSPPVPEDRLGPSEQPSSFNRT